MTESRNIFDLLGKIDWEGGITGILDYGERNIDDYDVPDALKEAWSDMADRYGDFETEMDNVMDVLDRCAVQYNEQKEF
jgi:hypothetical protein